MGRVSDMQIELFDEYYASQQNEPEPIKRKSKTFTAIEQLRAERDFYKARFEWERARVYKAWRNNPEARHKLAYKRRWKSDK